MCTLKWKSHHLEFRNIFGGHLGTALSPNNVVVYVDAWRWFTQCSKIRKYVQLLGKWQCFSQFFLIVRKERPQRSLRSEEKIPKKIDFISHSQNRPPSSGPYIYIFHWTIFPSFVHCVIFKQSSKFYDINTRIIMIMDRIMYKSIVDYWK